MNLFSNTLLMNLFSIDLNLIENESCHSCKLFNIINILECFTGIGMMVDHFLTGGWKIRN